MDGSPPLYWPVDEQQPEQPPFPATREVPDYGGTGIDYSDPFVTDNVFQTHHDAFQWARPIAVALGFVLVINSHKKQKNGRLHICFKCTRHHKNVSAERDSVAERFDTKSKGCNCPFYIKARERSSGDGWDIVVSPGFHGMQNHPLIVYQQGHRALSHLSPGAKKIVREMSRAQAKPTQILCAVKDKHPGDNATPRHIYNERQKLKREESEGRRLIQQFLHLASEERYVHWIRVDRETRCLTAAFMAHPTMVDMMRTWPYCIGIDSTYKTNRYEMPFVEIVGVTPCDQNFLIGYCIMMRETKEDYRWALWKLKQLLGPELTPTTIFSDRESGLIESVHEVFPETAHLLCTWHINKVMHFGNTTTCRVESQHSVIKTWLQTSTGDLVSVFKTVHRAVEVQIIQIQYQLESCRRRFGGDHVKMPFLHLVGYVSHRALTILKDEKERMRGLSDELYERCGCLLRWTHGLPCACTIHCSIEGGTGLYIDMVYPFWRSLVIGEGFAHQAAVDESAQDAARFRELVDEVMQSDPATIRNVSRMLESELHPDAADLEEPEVNEARRGRPGTQTQRASVRRNPCFHEHVARESRNRRNCEQRIPSRCGIDFASWRYRRDIPSQIFDKIEEFVDVRGDVNCGFRCVAHWWLGDQEEWRFIRNELANEVAAKRAHYNQIYLGEVDAALHRIRWFGNECGDNHWMITMQDLFPIANVYNARVMMFQVGQNGNLNVCYTVLPTYAPRNSTGPTREISIGFIGRLEHYVYLRLTEGCPMPPIAHMWFQWRDDSVAGWEHEFQGRIEDWRNLVGRNI